MYNLNSHTCPIIYLHLTTNKEAIKRTNNIFIIHKKIENYKRA